MGPGVQGRCSRTPGPLTVAIGDVTFTCLYMASRRIEVFSYGLFMDADLLRAKGVHPVGIRPAWLPGFALRIGQRATLIRNPDSRAHGLLMELTHDEMRCCTHKLRFALTAQRPY